MNENIKRIKHNLQTIVSQSMALGHQHQLHLGTY